MILKAYALAADPAWIEASIRSYYAIVEEIVISYDRQRKGWTGAAIPVDECLDRFRAVDPDKKMRFVPGDFARLDHSPMANDTHQRQCATDEASKGADWVLSLDSDEILPDAKRFAQRLREEIPQQYQAVQMPMRVLFRQTGPERFLEVCHYLRGQYSEFPGCVAIRPGNTLMHSRVPNASIYRYDVRRSGRIPDTGEVYHVHTVIPGSEAILHFSWARHASDLQAKLRSWSHTTDRGNWESYLEEKWRPAPGRWPLLYNFHPIWPGRWPALRPVRLPGMIGPGPSTSPITPTAEGHEVLTPHHSLMDRLATWWESVL